MSERPPGPVPPGRSSSVPDEQAEVTPRERGEWTREDDELLLLDEIEETPDDDVIDDLV